MRNLVQSGTPTWRWWRHVQTKNINISLYFDCRVFIIWRLFPANEYIYRVYSHGVIYSRHTNFEPYLMTVQYWEKCMSKTDLFLSKTFWNTVLIYLRIKWNYCETNFERNQWIAKVKKSIFLNWDLKHFDASPEVSKTDIFVCKDF
jgi:hypothetical protein